MKSNTTAEVFLQVPRRRRTRTVEPGAVEPVFFKVPVWVRKGTRFDLPLRQRVRKSTRGRLPGTKIFQTGNIMTDLMSYIWTRKQHFLSKKYKSIHPNPIFSRCARSLPHDHNVISCSHPVAEWESVNWKQIAAKRRIFCCCSFHGFSPGSGDFFWRYFFRTRFGK